VFIKGDLGTYYAKIVGVGNKIFLLESGMMHTHQQWNQLQKTLSKFGTIISYDRLGYGLSEESFLERSSNQQALECIDFLKGLNINKPIIMIAHSLGSYIALLAQKYIPDRFSAIILLDPTHPRIEENYQKIYEKMLYQYSEIMYFISRTKIRKPVLFRKNDQENLSNNPKHWKTVLNEWDHLNENNKLIKKLLSGKTKTQTPVLVLTAGKQSGIFLTRKSKNAFLQEVIKAHKEYADFSIQGKQVMIENLNHNKICGSNEKSCCIVEKEIINFINMINPKN
jgi:pimeloyl-ACP methyl ester carboxylesterase